MALDTRQNLGSFDYIIIGAGTAGFTPRGWGIR